MHNGIAITLAWPETKCKQAGAWYDPLMNLLKISKDNYYKVGHAAIVLISFDDLVCHYFDFGRYHAPFGHGRVRSKYTDHDLEIRTNAIINENQILENFEAILEELHANESCHGDGPLHASYTLINFEKAYNFAIELQKLSPHPYGPFEPRGTNCSRFVSSTVLKGNPSLIPKLKLKYPKTLSPTPIGNVKALSNYKVVGYKNCNLEKTILNFQTN